jgi:hypothetical protein
MGLIVLEQLSRFFLTNGVEQFIAVNSSNQAGYVLLEQELIMLEQLY